MSTTMTWGHGARRKALALLAAFGLLASLITAFSPPALGEGNPPDVECASTDPAWNGEYWKVQVSNGNLGGVETNVAGAISLGADGSWTNNNDDAVFRIVLKVGGGVGDDQVLSGSWATGEGGTIDLDLNGLSHVTFCFTDEVPAEPGQIIVTKRVARGSDRSIAFTFTTDFAISDNTLAHGESGTSGDLDAGTYSVSETVPAGWILVGAVCDDGSDPSAIELDEGEIVTCTFSNAQVIPDPEPGQIVVEKVVTAGSDQGVAFSFVTDFAISDDTLAHGESGTSGDLDAGTYSVSETVPAGWSLVSAVCDDGSDPAAIGLDEGEVVTCTFTNEEQIPDPDPETDLEVAKVDLVDPVVVDSDNPTALITYEVTVSNNGPELAENVVVTDTLAATTTYVSSAPAVGTCAHAGGVVTCELGDLAVGGSVLITVVVETEAVGAITDFSPLNVVEVSSDTEETNLENNVDDEETDILEVLSLGFADLEVTKIDLVDPVVVDSDDPTALITYEVTVTNNGPELAENVVVTDTLAATTTYVSSAPAVGTCAHAAGVVTCELGDLAEGESVKITVVVETEAVGEITDTSPLNVVEVSSDTEEVNLANNVASEETDIVEVLDLVVLPFTGIDTPFMLAGAIMLLGAGLTLVVVSRRRELEI